MVFPTSAITFGPNELSHTNSLGDSNLTSDITGASSSIVVDSISVVTTWPATDFVVKIDSELVYVESRSGTTLNTLTRGYDNTTAASHVAGVQVKVVLPSKTIEIITQELESIEKVLKGTLAGDIIVTGNITSTGGTISATGGTVVATSLKTATSEVAVSAATHPTNGQFLKYNGTSAVWDSPSSATSTVGVKDDGTAVTNSPFGTLNFVSGSGMSVVAADGGSGQVNITFTNTSGGGTADHLGDHKATEAITGWNVAKTTDNNTSIDLATEPDNIVHEIFSNSVSAAHYFSVGVTIDPKFLVTINDLRAFVPLSMNSNKITGLATPTAGTDAANKSYVDGVGGSTAAFMKKVADSDLTMTSPYKVLYPDGGAISQLFPGGSVNGGVLIASANTAVTVTSSWLAVANDTVRIHTNTNNAYVDIRDDIVKLNNMALQLEDAFSTSSPGFPDGSLYRGTDGKLYWMRAGTPRLITGS